MDSQTTVQESFQQQCQVESRALFSLLLQGLLSEEWEQAALHQCLPPVCKQAGRAAAQSHDSCLSDHTPAQQGAPSHFGSLHLSTGT